VKKYGRRNCSEKIRVNTGGARFGWLRGDRRREIPGGKHTVVGKVELHVVSKDRREGGD